MSMAVSDKGGVNHDINVTPLIDVVLVLLIIFMVLTPMMQKAHQVNLPAPPDASIVTTPQKPDTQLILSMDKDKALYLNQDSVEKTGLSKRVAEVLGANTSKILFFKCDPSIKYGEAVSVMDICRGAGAQRIGIITEELKKAAEAEVTGEAAAPEDAAVVPPPV